MKKAASSGKTGGEEGASPATLPLLPDWLQAQLDGLLHHPGHALLLHGPSGLGQFELGLHLAASWLCEQPGVHGACGQCGSCHALAVHTHPDLMVLMPEVQSLALGWPLSESAQKDLDDKKRKPSKEIRVEAMREVVQFGQRSASSDRGKVVFIYPAEQMNTITANTLLKTLEEPAGGLRFVLATRNAYELLPTVRSRCQAQALAHPDAAQALQWLQAQGLKLDEAQVLLRVSGERPGEALSLHQAQLGAALWRAFPQAVARGETAAVSALAPAQLLDGLQKLCHDLLRVRWGAPPRFFEAADLPAPPSARALSAWLRALNASARTVEHPYIAGLFQESLISQGARVLARPATAAGRR